MTPGDELALRQENDDLRRRNAQLRDDVTCLGGLVQRMQRQLDHISGRDPIRTFDPPLGDPPLGDR